MNKDYKIQAVSEKVKNWSSQYGDFTTYYVKLSGNSDEAVQLNKKSDSPAPNEGDELYGEIQQTEFGSKFKSQIKSQKKPFGGIARPSESQDTQDNIARSVALKAAVDYWSNTENTLTDYVQVLAIAEKFLEWLQNTGSQSSSPAVPTPSGSAETKEEKSQPARVQTEPLEVPPEWQ